MNLITVQSNINSPISKVWEYWTKEEHIVNWNFATADWHCPDVTNNLKIGGEFHYTMAAKDNSMIFDFWGTYQNIEIQKKIEIILGDGRVMKVNFESTEVGTLITEQFEPEQQNTTERQQAGWQMILDNFKKYVEQ
ncbi:MAG: polyketide cyclase [Chitinophagia bacterium]|nr:polyketide cyclase [Chitinophagia bacterium]NCA30439.1 polyketide cyclase [Chitinophagia bacterium]